MNYHMIRTDDMLNGSGLRVVIFLSGCDNRCEGCHNPETWNQNSGKKFDAEAIKEIMNELDNDYISGITLSGGDPLYESNVNDVYDLLILIKEKYPNKTIWLYTGYSWNGIMNPVVLEGFNPERDALLKKRKDIVALCDVLCDSKFIEAYADVNCPWVGSSNQRVIDVQKTLATRKIVLYNN